jgi:hypothetical protein
LVLRVASDQALFVGERRTLLVVAKDEPTWLPVTCAGCGQRWYGIERAHCACCHRTFATLDLFDQHRVDHLCHNPALLSAALSEDVRVTAAAGVGDG